MYRLIICGNLTSIVKLSSQFLPQDKVVEFAQLKPEELLLATQKATDSSELVNWFQEIIRIQSNQASIQQVYVI